jgi:2-C-methyl-D-erythritol 4-phosphate cytidylyltransferase/2-C-methyl-D-erythritol 4-phosphate cytidylyltransferase/2-C-methyl-D-erythritol 2,4-cyclodiphosphate synthase
MGKMHIQSADAGSPVFAAVICAAGSSTRMGGVKKEYQLLPRAAACGSLTVLGAAASAFAACPRLSVIVISVPNNAEQGEEAARQALPAHLLAEDAPVKILFAAGGASRRISVLNALTALEVYAPDYVLIHDGARPWISPALIDSLLDAVQQYKAVIPAMPAVETPKQIDSEGFITKNLTRRSIVLAQTPQSFAFAEILSAHRQADQKAALNHEPDHEPDGCREYTDDAEVWGAFINKPIKTIDGDKRNVKITFREDLH